MQNKKNSLLEKMKQSQNKINKYGNFLEYNHEFLEREWKFFEKFNKEKTNKHITKEAWLRKFVEKRFPGVLK